MTSNAHLIVSVYTGNRKYAGTDSTVSVIIHGDNGTSSKTMILNDFSNNFEQEKIDTFRLKEVENLDRFVEIERIELWKGKRYGLFADEWYVDKIVVENVATNTIYVFPVFRWIKPGYHYQLTHLDTSLPQFDKFQQQRRKELEEKRQVYQFDQKLPNGPAQVKTLPKDEQFTFDYLWDLAKYKKTIQFSVLFNKLFQKTRTRIEDLDDVYLKNVFKKPGCALRWDSDIEFGRQRLASINPTIISLLRNVPAKFPISDELLGPLLEGLSLQDAIAQKRLFLCDLKMFEDIPKRPNITICSPFALFFVDKDRQLRPIAIQLFQEPGPENPIFTPLDDPMLWKLVKMWYNCSDCSHHQALTHLGFTHLLMEGVAIAFHRNLSSSHPVFKLLAPHFLFLIAINSRALDFLVAPGGWVDKTMAMGAKGLAVLAAIGFDEWRMDVQGLLPEDLKDRGVDDPNVLPGYYFRDDALPMFYAIHKYVQSYLGLYYTSQEMIKEDFEIQAWAKELVKPRNKSQGGVGLKGVPGNGSIETTEDLINIITCIIYTCSVSHASANFGQYEEYGYPPRYPSMLHGKPPSSKDVKVTEKFLVDSLANYNTTQDILTVTAILSRRGTNSLGDFEVQYVFDPRATPIVAEFRKDLKEINQKIKARNEQLDVPYEYLLPENIPNSISI